MKIYTLGRQDSSVPFPFQPFRSMLPKISSMGQEPTIPWELLGNADLRAHCTPAKSEFALEQNPQKIPMQRKDGETWLGLVLPLGLHNDPYVWLTTNHNTQDYIYHFIF